MARTQRDWSELKAEVYGLLREDEASSYWTSAQLVSLWNAAMDRRVQQLADQDEGWVTEVEPVNLVAGQRRYTLPEHADRVKRVVIVRTLGDRVQRVPLIREEHFSTPTITPAGGATRRSYRPTYRFLSNDLVLTPAPPESVTDGLELEIEALPELFTDSDGDKLPSRLPIALESLLVYDTAVAALAVEGTQGNAPEGWADHLLRERAEKEKTFLQYAARRTGGRIFGQPHYLGD